MQEFTLSENQEYITLNQLLKVMDFVNSGGEAKNFILNSTIDTLSVNGQEEHRIRCKIYPNTIVRFLGNEVKVVK